jgi:hypothetical protein
MDRFDKAARRATTATGLQAAWRRIMKTPLSEKAAQVFLRHYKTMRSHKKQRGGAAYTLSGASTQYDMGPAQAVTPGSAAFGPIQYGHFTDDVTANASLLRQVGGPAEIPEIAQNKDCGVDRFPTLAQAQLAQVGAGRFLRAPSRMKRGRSISRKNRKNRKNRKSRKQRGGNLLNYLIPSTAPVSAGSKDGIPGEHGWTPLTNGANPFSNVMGLHGNLPVPTATVAAWS